MTPPPAAALRRYAASPAPTRSAVASPPLSSRRAASAEGLLPPWAALPWAAVGHGQPLPRQPVAVAVAFANAAAAAAAAAGVARSPSGRRSASVACRASVPVVESASPAQARSLSPHLDSARMRHLLAGSTREGGRDVSPAPAPSEAWRHGHGHVVPQAAAPQAAAPAAAAPAAHEEGLGRLPACSSAFVGPGGFSPQVSLEQQLSQSGKGHQSPLPVRAAPDLAVGSAGGSVATSGAASAEDHAPEGQGANEKVRSTAAVIKQAYSERNLALRGRAATGGSTARDHLGAMSPFALRSMGRSVRAENNRLRDPEARHCGPLLQALLHHSRDGCSSSRSSLRGHRSARGGLAGGVAGGHAASTGSLVDSASYVRELPESARGARPAPTAPRTEAARAEVACLDLPAAVVAPAPQSPTPPVTATSPQAPHASSLPQPTRLRLASPSSPSPSPSSAKPQRRVPTLQASSSGSPTPPEVAAAVAKLTVLRANYGESVTKPKPQPQRRQQSLGGA